MLRTRVVRGTGPLIYQSLSPKHQRQTDVLVLLNCTSCDSGLLPRLESRVVFLHNCEPDFVAKCLRPSVLPKTQEIYLDTEPRLNLPWGQHADEPTVYLTPAYHHFKYLWSQPVHLISYPDYFRKLHSSMLDTDAFSEADGWLK